jgi:hypothetical protein
MALSPWHVASFLHCHDVASLLADDIPHEYGEWRRAIFNAAHLGELKPCRVMEHAPKPGIKLRGEELMLSDCSWQPRDVDDTSWHLAGADRVRLTFERQEVYRWLKSRGATHGDIPEALRAKPEQSGKHKGNDEDINPRKEATYQKIIAALVALQYGHRVIEQPYALADEMLADCELKGFREPAGRSTLGPIFENLPAVQKVSLD